jgi:hypothetical protein
VSEAFLAGRGDRPGIMLRKMRLLEAGGFPSRTAALDYEKVADVGEDVVYILKAKPSCWRVYFVAEPASKRLIFLHAHCKLRQRRDPDDPQKAIERLERIRAARAQLQRLAIPDR